MQKKIRFSTSAKPEYSNIHSLGRYLNLNSGLFSGFFYAYAYLSTQKVEGRFSYISSE